MIINKELFMSYINSEWMEKKTNERHFPVKWSQSTRASVYDTISSKEFPESSN